MVSSLEVNTREPVNAKAMSILREKTRRTRADDGKDEQRFTDVDIRPLVVSQNIAASSVGREQLMAYAKAHGGNAMVKYLCSNSLKISDLIDRAWQAECPEQTVAEHAKTRIDYIMSASRSPCVCDRDTQQMIFLHGTACTLLHGPRRCIKVCCLDGRKVIRFAMQALKETRGNRSFCNRWLLYLVTTRCRIKYEVSA